MPTEYRNALIQVAEYVKLMHMSKMHVYRQLTSPYGAKFQKDTAQWAINHLTDVDWKQEALFSAKDYMKHLHMSKQRLYNQLKSTNGAQFTEEEAKKGMK